MGKRLDQQPMYPQYTYYYPHYLQTKVGHGGAGCGGPGAPGSAGSRRFTSLRWGLWGFFYRSVSRRAELVGRKQARERQEGCCLR